MNMIRPYNTVVQSAAESRDLTVLATLKEELNIATSDADAFLARIITEQSQGVVEYCKRDFAKETLTDFFEVDHRHWHTFRRHHRSQALPLILSRRPVQSVSAVIEAGVALSSTDYRIQNSAALLWRLDSSGFYMPWNFGQVQVTFIAGYTLLTELPTSVERAVIMMCKQAYYARRRDPALRGETVEGIGSQTYFSETATGGNYLPAEAEALLGQYRTVSAL